MEGRSISIPPAVTQKVKRLNFARVEDEPDDSIDVYGGVEESKDDKEDYCNNDHVKDEDQACIYIDRNQYLSEEDAEYHHWLNTAENDDSNDSTAYCARRPPEEESKLDTVIQRFTNMRDCG